MNDTALTVRSPADLAALPPAALAHRDVARVMIEASVVAFGDVVAALLCDLERTDEGVGQLAWLSQTRSLLKGDGVYAAAVAQLAWWDGFLAELPRPSLLSEAAAAGRRQARAERAQVQLQAREQALQEHRAKVAAALAGCAAEDAHRLQRIYDDPDETEWWVDAPARVAAALAALPPAAAVVPITTADLEATTSFAGFRAVDAMRSHAVLGPRAATMDAALAAVLRRELRLPKAAAATHAQRLTDIFWIALRRALSAGNHQLAASVVLLLSTDQSRVQAQFTDELLGSWLPYLRQLPPPRPTLGERLRGLLGGKRRQLTGQ